MTADELSRLVVDACDEGRFTVHRRVFGDPAIFELEMKYIFEKTWVFLGLGSQAPEAHDFFTTWIGRHPVLVMRDGQGELGAFFNTCRHRGAVLTPRRSGKARVHVCPYHGWSFDSGGHLKQIKDRQAGAYSADFEAEDHDLVRIARFASYRGFLFGCLSSDAPALETFLGDTRFFLDLVVDQAPGGMELVPGSSTYMFKANWKLQVENGLDAYHLTSTHPSFMKIVDRRKSGESGYRLKAVDFGAYSERGGFTFDHGHAALFTPNPSPEIRPLYASIDEVAARVGKDRAQWMLTTRNLVMFPNLQVAENASLQLRVIRPIAHDLTEMTIHCIAPVGEPDDARDFRLRQFEDFFNASGMATPDDTTCYEDCQTGYGARLVEWQQGYSRGMLSVERGANDIARRNGLHPRTSQTGEVKIQDETIFHSAYREWRRLMVEGARHDEQARAAA